MITPVLISAVASKSDVTFTWQPYDDPTMNGLHGSVQGFDETGRHVIGAFVYGDQLKAGSITVPLDHHHGKTIQCELDVVWYADTAWTQYTYVRSNLVALT